MTRPNLNAVALVPDHLDGATASTGFVVLRAWKIDPRWIYYSVQGSDFVTAMVSRVQGALYPAVRPDDVRSYVIPLAPAEEQKRIADSIDINLSRLQSAGDALARVRANVIRYRASVLKDACEGRLVPTEAELARREGRNYETADVLLGRALKERRTTWEEQELEELRAKGQEPTDDRWKRKYKEPETPNPSQLWELPEGWAWATVHQLNQARRPVAYGVLQPGPHVEGGVPLVRVGDLDQGRIKVEGMKMVAPEIAARYPRTRLQGGEVLLTLVGTIGRTAVVPPEMAGANTARAVGVIPLTPSVRPRWVELWFRNPAQIARLTAAAHEVARKTLNLEDVRFAPVALPPLAEQDRILSEVAAALSIVGDVASQVDRAEHRANRLRQSILKRAFEGRLVAQDPSDEPASALLERIQAERNAGEARVGAGF
jgi:type I restriction enzyme, S subunit